MHMHTGPDLGSNVMRAKRKDGSIFGNSMFVFVRGLDVLLVLGGGRCMSSGFILV